MHTVLYFYLTAFLMSGVYPVYSQDYQSVSYTESIKDPFEEALLNAADSLDSAVQEDIVCQQSMSLFERLTIATKQVSIALALGMMDSMQWVSNTSSTLSKWFKKKLFSKHKHTSKQKRTHG